jgi:hypothetical protein
MPRDAALAKQVRIESKPGVIFATVVIVGPNWLLFVTEEHRASLATALGGRLVKGAEPEPEPEKSEASAIRSAMTTTSSL